MTGPPWRYIADDDASATSGLAADEWLMTAYHGSLGGPPGGPDKPPPTLRLYTYRPHCVLVGRFQNVEAEVRLEECERRGIAINRRPTGGGTIMMGTGQLGVAVVTSLDYPGSPTGPREAIHTYAQGIVAGLEGLGIRAACRGKNDLEVGGRKIAGLGVYVDEERALLFHCSLLVELDLSLMLSLLNIPLEKLSDRAVATLGARLTTVSQELGHPVSTDWLRERIVEGFERAFGVSLDPRGFEPGEVEGIARLEQEKYLTPEWVYQRQPPQDTAGSARRKTGAGMLSVHLSLAGEVIKGLVISGDFFPSSASVNRLEARLRWSAAERGAVETVVKEELRDGDGILGLGAEELSDLILEAAANARTQGACFLRPRPGERGEGVPA
ncbi:MAG: lipoate--protein ligase [Dehalococcoidia bacterium]